MEKDIGASSKNSSINDLFTNFTRNSLVFVTEVNSETWGIAICAIITIIGATVYMYLKVKGSKCKSIHDRFEFIKGKELQKYSEDGSLQSHNFDYHKILSELHNACNNCSNIFSSMKCVQLVSSYPELINIKLFSDGVTPFHRVCFHGNEPLIEFMLAKGADPELKTVAGENALCMALYHYLYTEKKDFSCLHTLHKKGCHLNYGDEWYDILLNLAIRGNNKKLTKWMLSHSKSQAEKPFTRASSAPL